MCPMYVLSGLSQHRAGDLSGVDGVVVRSAWPVLHTPAPLQRVRDVGAGRCTAPL